MYRIFIVEDDEIIARTVKKHLESWDYEVAVAADFTGVDGKQRKGSLKRYAYDKTLGE